jgi:threonyl-tRNA synthetase
MEHHAGRFPLWLAPVPVVIATIVNQVDDYARALQSDLKALGISAETDLRNEKIGYKVREHSNAKVPLIFVIGEQEARDDKVAIRRLGSTETQVTGRAEAIAMLVEQTKMPT